VATNGWQTVPLGDVLELDIDRVRVTPEASYEIAGVLIAGRGLFRRESILGSQTTYPTLHRLRAGQLVYRKLTAWEGPITVVTPDFAGTFVSSEFPTFTPDETRLLPDFLRVVCQRPTFHEEMRLRSTGTAERRNRLKPDDLLDIEIELPALPDQRRIAEAVAVVDKLIESYALEQDAATALLVAMREQAFASMDSCSLREVVPEIQAGKSPKGLDRPPTHGERGVLKVSAIREGEFRPTEAKAVSPETTFPEHAAVRRGDVLIGRANTTALVGAACRVDDDVESLYLSDKTLRLVVDEARVNPDFVVHALASSLAREQIEAAATGTSDSMKNISQRVILDLEIPFVESPSDQLAIAGQLGSIRRATVDAKTLAAAAQRMRDAMLESLLAGERRLSETHAI
jgi:type I restriction enzyme S subunit